MIPKVLAYIIRRGAHGPEVLVFRHRDHPDAGVQVPGGTVDAGEALIDALMREIEEESGLTDIDNARHITTAPFYADWRDEWQERNIFHLAAPSGLPDSWDHVVKAGKEDAGLCFQYSWMSCDDAATALEWGQGQWLHLIRA